MRALRGGWPGGWSVRSAAREGQQGLSVRMWGGGAPPHRGGVEAGHGGAAAEHAVERGAGRGGLLPVLHDLGRRLDLGRESVGGALFPPPRPDGARSDGSLPALTPLRVLRAAAGRSAYLGRAGLLFPGRWLRLRARLLLVDLCAPRAGGWGGAQAAEPAPLSPSGALGETGWQAPDLRIGALVLPWGCPERPLATPTPTAGGGRSTQMVGALRVASDPHNFSVLPSTILPFTCLGLRLLLMI